ncbi:uncharacterized protein LOC123410186 [Hordeum vulgare subsp. vulgare]|uniref:uncharacterized protein LOC123410186 n=1 Tax=Hordeum vulgare subsp. vulgare TaxID=112509 RepID=UPI00162B947B|nr:uncharacterized protein LOC123410186 [Hordeum vulgare subsp. vulgare]
MVQPWGCASLQRRRIPARIWREETSFKILGCTPPSSNFKDYVMQMVSGYYLMHRMPCWHGQPWRKVCHGEYETMWLTSRGTRLVSQGMLGCDGGNTEIAFGEEHDAVNPGT